MSMQPQAERGHLSRQQPSLALWRPQTYHKKVEDSATMNTPISPRRAPQVFASALLLVRHEDHAVVDRQSLRQAGIRSIHILTSGVEAARILSRRQRLGGNVPDLVVCDEQLSDMTGLEFLALIRSHPLLASFPILMTSMSDTPALRRTCKELTASGLLIRPYSGDACLNQLSRVAAVHPPLPQFPWDEDGVDVAAFERSLSRFALARKVSDQSAGQWFREGLQHLKQEEWEEAAIAFQQALKDQADHSDAIKGLTVALRKRQQESATSSPRGRLSPEATATLRANLLEAAQKPDPDAAVRRLVLDALSDDGAQDPDTMTRSYGTNSTSSLRPERAGLSRGDASEPPLRVLPGHNTTLAPLPELHESDGSGVLGRFPLLRDAVNVARITLGLYRTKRKN